MLSNLQKISKQDILIFLILIPLLNVVIFFLVSFHPEFFEFLYLNPHNPTIVNLFISHYTHIDSGHLSNNILNYFLVMIFILLLDVKNKEYRKNFLFIFLFLPFLLSSIMLYFSKFDAGNGFSGIVSALYGYFAYSVYVYIKREWGIHLNKNAAWLFILFNILGMLAIYQEFKEFFIFAILFMSVFFLNIGSLIKVQRKLMFLFKEWTNANKKENIKKLLPNFFVFSVTITILFFSFVSLFPSKLVTDYGAVTNIMIHYFGYILGLLFPLYCSGLIWRDLIKI